MYCKNYCEGVVDADEVAKNEWAASSRFVSIAQKEHHIGDEFDSQEVLSMLSSVLVPQAISYHWTFVIIFSHLCDCVQV